MTASSIIANILDKISGMAFFKPHLPFLGQGSDQQLAEHQEADAGMDQNDARPLAKHHHAAPQKDEAGDRSLGELPQNSHRGIAQHQIGPPVEPGRQGGERQTPASKSHHWAFFSRNVESSA